MNPRRLELSLDLLREVNQSRRECDRNGETRPWWSIAEQRLEQHDADARARADVRQRTIFDALAKRQA